MDDKPITGSQASKRLFALDALRGLIMLLMALDHANWFIAQKHSTGEHWGGPYPVYQDSLTFLTRLVTHPCAPGFAFLMGVGMLLFAESRKARGWSKWVIWRDLWIRGALLIALQLLVVNRAWELSPQGWDVLIYWGVLASLGGGMILGSLFVWLPWQALAGIAAALFIGMEFTHPDPSQWGTLNEVPLGLLLGFSGGTQRLFSTYPVLPWLELVIFGLLFGRWLLADQKSAYRRALWLGLVFLIAFGVVRALDGFGNIRPRMGDTWMDFLNPVKYPPAMTFTLLTMGFNLIVLWAFSQAKDRAQAFFAPLLVVGRVPLFFYVTHLFLYAGIAYWLVPAGGTSIPGMIPYWILGILILYPLCIWYGKLKHKEPSNTVLRFF
ncbi:MAG: heparan-alpha-glucosaminide N-acetyltransferase domain-containing protein [Anaerolineales bacterium]